MYQITVKDLKKRYKIYNNPKDRLKDWVLPKKYHSEFWALKGINFNVKPGESIGLIGHNGAGKSTLLKLLTGTIKPTEGEIVVNGRVTALLELGMGFHPDFTGIQNVYMTAQLMGFKNNEINELINEIEEFAEIGEHIHQPLRTYSSGMIVRLGFAVATAVRPDVLIVDEALAVGDAYFQHKCFKRIREYREQGTTLLFVSHDPGAVKNLCDRAILLNTGEQLMDGAPDTVLDYYNAIIAQKEINKEVQQSQGTGKKMITRSGDKKAEILEVTMHKDDLKVNAIQVADNIDILVEFKCNTKLVNPTVGILIKDRLGNDIFGTNTYHLGVDLGKNSPGTVKEVKFTVQANLGIGTYSISTAIHQARTHLEGNFDWWDQALTFQVIAGENKVFTGVNYLPVNNVNVKSKEVISEVRNENRV